MTFNRLRKFLLIFIGALIGICFYISFSYAYYIGDASVGSSTGASASAEGNIVLIDNTAITLTGDKAVPISDSKALSSTNYLNQFQIRNDKKSTVNVDVYMVPTTATTMEAASVRYALYDSAATKPTSGINFITRPYALSDAQKSYAIAKGYTPNSMGYKLGSFNLTSNQSKTLNLYLWISYNENGEDKSTYDSYFEGIIFIKITDETSDMSGTFYQMMASNSIVDSSTVLESTPTSANSGIYLKNDTASSDYPIMYYRGIVSNNNVLFDGFCWKIVRTTEKGGIKMIYNGVPSGTTCNNTGEASQLATTSVYNDASNSPAYVGYMYGDTDTITSKRFTTSEGTYLFGNSITYSSGYTLKGIASYSTAYSSLLSNKTNILRNYKYTCLSTSNTCTSVKVIINISITGVASGTSTIVNGAMVTYMILSSGDTVSSLKTAMFRNSTESVIKGVIDDWYEANLSDVTSKLEDTEWCNDRSIDSGTLVYTAGGGPSVDPNFHAYKDDDVSSLICSRTNDKFSVDTANGNGALDNPVGLLTSNEYYLAGSGKNVYSADSYLNTGVDQWSLSPARYSGGYVLFLSSSGYLTYASVNVAKGVRPAIALKHTTKIASGDGSASNPYVVS